MANNNPEYNARWAKANLTQVKINLHKEKDADILERLETVGNKAEYIRKLIRKDMN